MNEHKEDEDETILCKSLLCSNIETIYQETPKHTRKNKKSSKAIKGKHKDKVQSSGYGVIMAPMSLGQGPTIAKAKAKSRMIKNKQQAKEKEMVRMMVS